MEKGRVGVGGTAQPLSSATIYFFFTSCTPSLQPTTNSIISTIATITRIITTMASTPPSDSKTASLRTSDQEEAPPSYTETSAPKVIGDGNVFSDMPRPGSMSYAPPATRSAYVPRAERPGSWSFGMFSCFGDMNSGDHFHLRPFSRPSSSPADFLAATKACCCPCVSYGQTRHRMQNPGSEAPVFTAPCLGYCLTLSFFPGAESIFGLLNRNELRARLDIDQAPRRVQLPGAPAAPSMFEGAAQASGFLDDAWRHVFCGCCALAQEDREVRRWEAEVADQQLGDLEAGEGLLASERD